MRIIVVESGALEPDRATQNLYDMEITGLPVRQIGSRLRYFGGTTNHWSGWCRQLDPAEIRTSSWRYLSGWPITHEEIAAH